MTASSRAPQGAGHPDSERSPFARLTELLAPYTARQASDHAVVRRTTAPGSGFCRPGVGQAYRRFRPLSDRQGNRAVSAGGRDWLSSRFRPAAAARSRQRNPGLERQPRRPVFRGADRGALCRPAQGPAGDPGAQPVLSGLWRRLPRRRLRNHLPADHARQRISARSRRARRSDAGAHRGDSTSPRRPTRRARWRRGITLRD